jgi:hypothetical protein
MSGYIRRRGKRAWQVQVEGAPDALTGEVQVLGVIEQQPRHVVAAALRALIDSRSGRPRLPFDYGRVLSPELVEELEPDFFSGLDAVLSAPFDLGVPPERFATGRGTAIGDRATVEAVLSYADGSEIERTLDLARAPGGSWRIEAIR